MGDTVAVAAPHRRGRRSSLIPPLLGVRSPWSEVLLTAADSDSSGKVGSAARFTVRRLIDAMAPTVHEVDLSAAAGLVPDELAEVRRPAFHTGMSSYAGLVNVPTQAGSSRLVWFESFNELSHYQDLLLLARPTQFATQPMRIAWVLPGGIRTHVPDALVLTGDDQMVLIDITTREKVRDPEVLAVFALTAATAAGAGWDYRLLTELPSQRARNLSFLRACRHPRPLPHDLTRVLAAQQWPCQAERLAGVLGHGAEGRGLLWHLLATTRLFTDLNRALTPDSLIHPHHLPDRTPSWLVEL